MEPAVTAAAGLLGAEVGTLAVAVLVGLATATGCDVEAHPVVKASRPAMARTEGVFKSIPDGSLVDDVALLTRK